MSAAFIIQADWFKVDFWIPFTQGCFVSSFFENVSREEGENLQTDGQTTDDQKSSRELLAQVN